ncbi:MarR family winged helix-turn-helix transcriptional regulator [Actinoplanes sp. OR16]|uniref:MarR family winged helix-turn-helix transcriptional regulator n=1 Tax=Actinoplanes sp. OR16 TaxID=946334 RepID=UPI001E5796FA|nr:MarR family winged helix-turn-helix transcriptional regulator [Actinoplanes sp. OR16]
MALDVPEHLVGDRQQGFRALRGLAHRESASQLQVAQTLGIDRTTMVALLDVLERKGIITRRTDPADRRRNVVEHTEHGLQTYDAARSRRGRPRVRSASLLPAGHVHDPAPASSFVGPCCGDPR